MADDITKRIARFIEPFRVSPGSSVKLAKDFDPAFKAGIKKKKDGAELLKGGIELLADYQARLAAQDTYGVLVVLQALDAAGKDGTIRHVMSGVNPQGVRVESFKVPSARELDQDFLRRYQKRLPSRGEIGIFNRSHYEEVLVVRVHPQNLLRQKLPAATREHHVWKCRFEAINDWERYLSDNGFRIVKLFLNLSKEEQRVRFLRRIDLPDHNWKFRADDLARHTAAARDLAHAPRAQGRVLAVFVDALRGRNPAFLDAAASRHRGRTAASEPLTGRHPWPTPPASPSPPSAAPWAHGSGAPTGTRRRGRGRRSLSCPNRAPPQGVWRSRRTRGGDARRQSWRNRRARRRQRGGQVNGRKVHRRRLPADLRADPARGAARPFLESARRAQPGDPGRLPGPRGSRICSRCT